MLSKITHKLGDNAFFVKNMVCIKSNVAYDIPNPILPKDISEAIDMLCRGDNGDRITYKQLSEEEISFNFFTDGYIDCTTAAYVFNVNCIDETEAIIFEYHSNNAPSYIWLNKDYIGKSNLSSLMQIKLKKGNNIFCFLFSNFKGSPMLAVRLNKLSNENRVEYVSVSTDNNIVRPESESIVRIIYNRHEKGR